MLNSFSHPVPAVPHISWWTPLGACWLCVKLSSYLSRHAHVQHIINKAQSHLVCLNMLRRTKGSAKDISQVYCSRVRPILEYASPVWHSGLSEELSDNIEDIQIRACKIAFPSITYGDALEATDMPSPKVRRELCRVFFEKIQSPDDKLHKIIP